MAAPAPVEEQQTEALPAAAPVDEPIPAQPVPVTEPAQGATVQPAESTTTKKR
jgi:hypothetical protein